MGKLFNILASGVRSLSFAPTLKMPRFDNGQSLDEMIGRRYERRFSLRNPRTPEEIMRAAWEDVGGRMWDAIETVEKEYGKHASQT